MSSRLSIPPHRYNLNMPPNNKSFDKKGLLADIGCLLGVIVPTLVFQCSADPVKRGFFCQDLDIRYPYHKETVSTSAAVLVALVAPVILFIIVEIQQYLSTSRSLKECMREMYGVTLVYLFGLASTTLITVLTKIMVGRHRPHFYQVCNPKSTDPDKNLCETEQSWSWTNPEYNCYESYECQGNENLFTDKETQEKRIQDASMSFVSGHASSSTFMLVFVILYLDCHLDVGNCRFLKPFIGMGFTVNTLVTCITRVTDNYHHPSDVFAGCLLGAIVAIMVHVLYVHRHNGHQQRSKFGFQRPSDTSTQKITNDLDHV